MLSSPPVKQATLKAKPCASLYSFPSTQKVPRADGSPSTPSNSVISKMSLSPGSKFSHSSLLISRPKTLPSPNFSLSLFSCSSQPLSPQCLSPLNQLGTERTMGLPGPPFLISLAVALMLRSTTVLLSLLSSDLLFTFLFKNLSLLFFGLLSPRWWRPRRRSRSFDWRCSLWC